ncbi:MAG TPA: Crp/Fnr family transcriptional regulator [Solirubrobacteraceae bacterium]|nr:Crp/Fnr family transcriptional regulator [Solirubrobacteraceae bacterium]
MTRRKPSLDSTCHLLREDPELARPLTARQRALAVDACTARVLDVRRGKWNQPGDELSDGVGLLVLDGLLLRRVSVGRRSGAELLGSGDVVGPWQEDAGVKLRRATAWRALQITRLAVLDDLALEGLAQYPEIMRELLKRSVERSRRLAVNMAIVHRPRVDIRLQLLFWHLADRWGRVRNGQTILPLRLSHSVLADLIAAQRPTVTTALADLASRGIVRPAPDGWLLLAPPPEDRPGPDTPAAIPRQVPTRRGRDRVLEPPHPRGRAPHGRRAGRDASTRPG